MFVGLDVIEVSLGGVDSDIYIYLISSSERDRNDCSKDERD